MINTNIRHFVLCLLMLVPCVIEAQTDRDFIRQGNKAYRLKNFPQAEVQYRKALSKNNGNPQALYNLGCALMMQNKASEAVKFYQKASEVETNKLRKAKIYHNIGIICQSGKMYGDAIKAYSESLRNNPHDNETRYNLALCKKLQKNGKNNKQQQQQNDKNKENGKDKQQQQKNKPDKEKANPKQQQQQPQMSKDNAEQLLNAAMQQEQQTQQRLNRQQQQQQSRSLEKNW